MADDKRAFELHYLALSVVRAMGRPVAGDNSVLEHRLGRLTIVFAEATVARCNLQRPRPYRRAMGRSPAGNAVLSRRLGTDANALRSDGCLFEGRNDTRRYRY